MQTKQEKLQQEIRELQVLWTIGAIERLANLGEIKNPPLPCPKHSSLGVCGFHPRQTYPRQSTRCPDAQYP